MISWIRVFIFGPAGMVLKIIHITVARFRVAHWSLGLLMDIMLNLFFLHMMLPGTHPSILVCTGIQFGDLGAVFLYQNETIDK